jgi:Flp pilus assembly protein TadB
MEPVASSQQFPRQRRSEPASVLITEAEPSMAEQHAFRKKRYAITMGIRALAIVLAAAFYQVVWLMLIFVFLGTILPWVAVLMANDRPPKKRLQVNRYDARPDRVLESRPVRVIDG